MTEELEKRLNELLDLKKELQDATEDKRKSAVDSALTSYQKKARTNFLRFVLVLAIGWAIMAVGLVAYSRERVIQIDPLLLLLYGLLVTIIAKMVFTVRTSTLSILMEMKQLEVRLMEQLRK